MNYSGDCDVGAPVDVRLCRNVDVLGSWAVGGEVTSSPRPLRSVKLSRGMGLYSLSSFYNGTSIYSEKGHWLSFVQRLPWSPLSEVYCS